MSDALKNFEKNVLVIADRCRVEALKKMEEEIREEARKELGEEFDPGQYMCVAIQQFHKRDVVERDVVKREGTHYSAFLRKGAQKKTSEGNVSNE